MLFKRKNISSLHIPHNKNTAGLVPTRIAPPKEVILPMNITSSSMNISKPVVSVGDHVRVGVVFARVQCAIERLDLAVLMIIGIKAHAK